MVTLCAIEYRLNILCITGCHPKWPRATVRVSLTLCYLYHLSLSRLFTIDTVVEQCNYNLRVFYSILKWDNLEVSIRQVVLVLYF